VSHRHETGFECGWREVVAGLQHRMEKSVERLAIAGHHFRVGLRDVLCKIDAEHAADRICAERHAVFTRRRGKTGDQCGSACSQGLIESSLTEQPQGCQPRGHRDRTARQRARLVDRTQWCDRLHDVAPPTECAHRHTPADHLAQCGQVRRDSVKPLHALRADAETGHDFVEDQHRTVFSAQASKAFEKAGQGFDQVHVARDRLDDDRRDLAASCPEQILDLLQIVEIEDDRVLCEIRRYPARRRIAEGQQARAGLDQKTVGMAVIAAFELDDSVTPGKAACEADRAHRRLGAGTDQPQHLDRRQQLADQLGHFDLTLGRCAERKATQRSLANRLHDGGVRVAGDCRPPRSDIVDVAHAVGVPHPRTLCPLDESRRSAHGAEGTNRRVDAARNGFLGTLE